MPVRDLDSWVLRFNNREMPIFSGTVSRIKEFSPNDRSSINELTRRILEDVALTIKVLTVANSVYYKPDKARVTTVQWALMLLGYNSIRSICSASPVVEELFEGPQLKRVIRERMKTLHGAIQARSFAASGFAFGGEEVFIAASLMRWGHLMFYSFGDEVVDELEICLNIPGYSPARAEREVLGFRLNALTAALSRGWDFSELLHASVAGRLGADPRVVHVLLGQSLAESVERGWDSAQVRRVIQTISSTLKRNVNEVTQLVHANAERAMQAGRDLGLGRYLDVIPLPKPPAADREKAGQSPKGFSAPAPPAVPEVELGGELGELLRKSRLDINLFFSTLLDGIMRDANMDRVLLAMLTPDLNHIVGKVGRGWEPDDVAHFVFSRRDPNPHIFEQVMEAREPLWINGNKRREWLRYLTPEVRAVMSTTTFFLMPIVIKHQAIGLICADRYASGRDLDEESFARFTRIHELAQEVLAAIV